MGCCARPWPGRPAGMGAFDQLPGVTSASEGARAGTSAAVKRLRISMQGVEEAIFGVEVVEQPVKRAKAAARTAAFQKPCFKKKDAPSPRPSPPRGRGSPEFECQESIQVNDVFYRAC